jgi:hypothetical protein
MRPVAVAPLMLLLVSLPVGIASAQVPAPVATPYTLMDAETRTYIQGGVETPLKGNGPVTGYAYLFATRAHFLDEDLYLRVVVPPGYLISELILDHFPSQNSALGIGVSGGFFAESQTEFQEGRYLSAESFTGDSAGGTLAYYLRGPKIFGVLPMEGQIRANPKYVWYDRSGSTSRYFRLPENTPIYDVRAGIRLGGVPPELFPNAAVEASVWHTLSYRGNAGHYGFAQELQETDHFTQRTWTRLGATYTFGAQQVSAFFNAGIAEDTDALSTFRMGGGLRLRAEFPLLLHGFYVEEIFARSFWLMNFAYRFPIWPGQDLVHLQLLGDVAQVNYIQGHHLPRSTLAGVGVNLSVAVTKRIDLVVGYGYGINAPRGNSFGGQEFDAQFQFKY